MSEEWKGVRETGAGTRVKRDGLGGPDLFYRIGSVGLGGGEGEGRVWLRDSSTVLPAEADESLADR